MAIMELKCDFIVLHWSCFGSLILLNNSEAVSSFPVALIYSISTLAEFINTLPIEAIALALLTSCDI
jgi:hypothetical protein